MLFPDYVEKYMDNRMATREASTRYQARLCFDTHLIPYFRTYELADIEQAEVEDFAHVHLLKQKGLAPKTINNIMGILGAYLRFCVVRCKHTKLTAMPPMPRMPRAKKIPVHLEPVDVERLIAVVTDEPYRLMLIVALNTGLRIGELLALRWENIDWKNRQLQIIASMGRDGSTPYLKCTKSGDFRQIPLSDNLLMALKNQLRLGPWVFMSHKTRKQLTYGAAYKAIKKYNKRAGINKNGWHLHRHTFGTLAMSVAKNPNDVRVLLGHSGWAMTMLYAHARPGEGRETIEALAAEYNPPVTRRAPNKNAS